MSQIAISYECLFSEQDLSLMCVSYLTLLKAEIKLAITTLTSRQLRHRSCLATSRLQLNDDVDTTISLTKRSRTVAAVESLCIGKAPPLAGSHVIPVCWCWVGRGDAGMAWRQCNGTINDCLPSHEAAKEGFGPRF